MITFQECEERISMIEMVLNEKNIEITCKKCEMSEEDPSYTAIYLEGYNWYCYVMVKEERDFNKWFLTIKPYHGVMTKDCAGWNMSTSQLMERLKNLKLT